MKLNKDLVMGWIWAALGIVCGLVISTIWTANDVTNRQLRFRTLCMGTVDALMCLANGDADAEIKKVISDIEQIQMQNGSLR